MAEEKSRVVVTINGKEYTIVAAESREYIVELSEYVNKRIKEICDHNASLNTEKASILTALNLCDDYYKCRANENSLQKQVIRYAKELEEATAKLKLLEDEISALKKEKEEREKEILEMIDKL
ncbi:MAG: cell division protein ZapA [Clostridia bacterium]|nr:cell division protein ZapA [Clostridia bacterium]